MRALLAFLFGASVGCFLRGWHDSKRIPVLGGARCRDCGKPFASFGDADALGDLTLSNLRKLGM